MRLVLRFLKCNKYLIIAIVFPLILIPLKYFLYFNLYYIEYKQIIILLFVSPIIEELLFRKYLQEYLFYKLNNLSYVIVITNFLFMILHIRNTLNILFLFGIFISGVIFSLVYYEKKLVIYPILIHFWFNLFYLLQFARLYRL